MTQTTLQQYETIKAKHPDAILLFRSNDWYLSFKEDAQDLADILGILLSKKDGNYQVQFPHYKIDSFIPRIIRAGKRIAICDLIFPNETTTKRSINDLK